MLMFTVGNLRHTASSSFTISCFPWVLFRLIEISAYIVLDLNFMLPWHFRYGATKSIERAGFKELLGNLILMLC
jgi:hypothetical protein